MINYIPQTAQSGQLPARGMNGYGGLNELQQQAMPQQQLFQQPIQPQQGSFGFGTGPGQLFGEGGALTPDSFARALATSISQPIRQGIIDPLASTIQSGQKIFGQVSPSDALQSLIEHIQNGGMSKNAPTARYYTDPSSGLKMPVSSFVLPSGGVATQDKAGNITSIGSGDKFVDAFSQPNTAIQNQTPFGVSNQEHSDYFQNPGLGGLKSAAGISSYALPGVVGGALPAAGSIGGAIGNGIVQGVAGGGAFGFGTSRPGQEALNTLIGMLTGGAAGGVLNGIGYGANQLMHPVTSYQPPMGNGQTGFMGKAVPGGGYSEMPTALDQSPVDWSLKDPNPASPFNQFIDPSLDGSDLIPRGSSMLNVLNNTLKTIPSVNGEGAAQAFGNTGANGGMNTALNYLSGNQSIRNALSQAGFNPTPLQVSQLAQELMNNYGNQIPRVLQSMVQNNIR